MFNRSTCNTKKLKIMYVITLRNKEFGTYRSYYLHCYGTACDIYYRLCSIYSLYGGSCNTEISFIAKDPDTDLSVIV